MKEKEGENLQEDTRIHLMDVIDPDLMDNTKDNMKEKVKTVVIDEKGKMIDVMDEGIIDNMKEKVKRVILVKMDMERLEMDTETVLLERLGKEDMEVEKMIEEAVGEAGDNV